MHVGKAQVDETVDFNVGGSGAAGGKDGKRAGERQRKKRVLHIVA